jgi:hypothetical protein
MADSAPITQAKVLLVEGKNEEQFFGAFFQHIGINDVQIRQIFGKDQLAANLRLFMNEAGYSMVTAFAIIRDADVNSEDTFKSVVGTLKSLGLPFPKRNGEFANKNRKKVGVFIMPDGRNPGMLEHLCLTTVSDHPIMQHVNTLFTAFGRELVKRDSVNTPMQPDKNYYPKNEAKAKVQAFLSGMYKTVHTAGLGAREKYWNFDHACLADLKKFLENLCTPV